MVSEIELNKKNSISETNNNYSVSFWTAVFNLLSLQLYKQSPFSCDAYICYLEIIQIFLESSKSEYLAVHPKSKWLSLYTTISKRSNKRHEGELLNHPSFFRRVLHQTIDSFMYLEGRYHNLLFCINDLFWRRFLDFVPETEKIYLLNDLFPKLRLAKDRLIQGDHQHSDSQIISMIHLLSFLQNNIETNEILKGFKSDLLMDLLTGKLLERPNLLLKHEVLNFLGQIIPKSKKLSSKIMKKLTSVENNELISAKNVSIILKIFSNKECYKLGQTVTKYLHKLIDLIISSSDKLITMNSPPSVCDISTLYYFFNICHILKNLSDNFPSDFFKVNIKTTFSRILLFFDSCIKESLDVLSSNQKSFLITDYFSLLCDISEFPTTPSSLISKDNIHLILSEISNMKFSSQHNLKEAKLNQTILKSFKIFPWLLSSLRSRLISGLLSKVYAFILTNSNWFLHFSINDYISNSIDNEYKQKGFLSNQSLDKYCLEPLITPFQMSFLLIDFQELIKNNLLDFPSNSFFFNKDFKGKEVADKGSLSEVCQYSYIHLHVLMKDRNNLKNGLLKDSLNLINKFVLESSLKKNILEKFIESILENFKLCFESQNTSNNAKICKIKTNLTLLYIFIQKLLKISKKNSEGNFVWIDLI